MKIPERVKTAIKTRLVFDFETFYPLEMKVVKAYCRKRMFREYGKTRVIMCNDGRIHYSQEFVEDNGGV